MEFLISVFSRSGFLPHGYCFNWTPGLLWTMVGADALIAAAYFSIPVAILSFVRQRGEPGINRLALLFSAFIFACGITHVMDVWTVWHPDYALHALSKSITAAISIVTAVMLWRLIPEALKVPAVQHLQSTVVSLEAEIARRREAERQVVDIQQSLAVTLASIGAGFVATDRAGKVSRMNAVAERLLGWTQDEARGQSLWQVFDREDRPPQFLAMNPVDVVIEQGTSVETVHRVVAISRDGRRTEVDVQAALTREDDGTIIGLAMVVRDMTQQARAEAESIRLASIVESSNDAIIGKTLDGRITSWNAAAQRMFGYSEEQAIGQHIQMLIPPELKGDEMRILGELSRGHPIPPFVAERLTCTGERLDVSITISPIRDGSGRLIGACREPPDPGGQPAQERVPGQHVARAAHAAQRDHRLHRPHASGFVTGASPKHQEYLGDIAHQCAASAPADQRRARSGEGRVGQDGVPPGARRSPCSSAEVATSCAASRQQALALEHGCRPRRGDLISTRRA
jgi:PAS domain S-box-containing protein